MALYDTPQKLLQGAFDSKQQIALQRLLQHFNEAEIDPLETANVISNTGTKAAVSTLTVAEAGDSYHHVTTLTLTAFAVGDSADNAALSDGALIYTLPAGAIIVDACSLDVALTLADAVQTDTPELGVGTTVGSGANATLGAVGAAAENVFEGTAVANVAGTTPLEAVKQPTAATTLLISAAADHTLYLNVADTWADLTAASAITATGTVRLVWRFVV